jgi:Ca2+-binding RTX toxin-like protein
MSSANDIITVILLSLGDYYAVDGGAGTDRLVVEAQALNADLIVSGNSTYDVTHSDPASILVTADNFESYKIIAGSGHDSLTGSRSDDELNGGFGNDELDGLFGEDTLIGGSGDDRLTVGDFAGDIGPDIIDGGDGFDYLLKLPRNTLSDAQDITLNFLLPDGAEFTLSDGTHVSNIERISNLQLGDGNDTVKFVPKSIADRHHAHGGVGDDHLNVTLNHITDDIKTAVGAQLFIVYPDGQSPFAAPIVAANQFETFRIISGSGNDSLRGGDGGDRLEGNAGNDKLTGAGGNDTLLGGSGDDRLLGGDGNDRLMGDPGADELQGGDGIDTVNYLNSPAGVIVDISTTTPVASGGDAEFDTFISIESVDGSEYDDTISSTDENNLLRGRGGDDVIYGRGGNDALGGAAGNDELHAGDGHDRLYGGDGNDTLHGGTGNDRMWGDGGADTFIMRAGDGTDKILDFDLGSSDIIDLSDFQVSSFSLLQSMTSQIASDVRVNFPTGDVLIIENIPMSQLQSYHFFL